MDVIPAIRTTPQTTRRGIQAHDDDGARRMRLLAKILRELVAQASYEGYADLKTDFRQRLVKLRIRCRQCEFDDVISLVGSSVRFMHAKPPTRTSVAPAPAPLSRSEAARLFAVLMPRGDALKRMPSVASPIDIYGPVPRPDFGEFDRY